MNFYYKNLLGDRDCNKCESRAICFLRRIPLNHYPENVQNFVIYRAKPAFNYWDSTRQWHASYQEIQKQILQCYEAYNCVLVGNEVRILTNTAQRENDKQRIRELVKQYLDMASKATEDKDPELSIVFDGIGLILASDYLEAVGKIFSMFKTMEQIKIDNTKNCNLVFS